MMKGEYKTKKIQAAKRLVPAGAESNLLSKERKRRMPTTKEYSEMTKVYSPNSRGI